MTRARHVTLRTFLVPGLALVLGLTTLAGAVERFPPPQFERAYTQPETTAPLPRAAVGQFADAGLLVVALAVSAYLVLRRRSRAAVVAWMLVCLAYFGFYRKGCICPVGSIQNCVMALFNNTYAAPTTVLVFFLAPLVFTLFFGRVFCAGVCPLGAVQDLTLLRPVQVPRWLDQTLGLLAYVVLTTAVVLAATASDFVVCRYDPYVAVFRRSGNATILAFSAVLIALGAFVGRPYCRYLCPYGAILRSLSRISRWRVTITPDDCIQCRLCEQACPYGAIQGPSQQGPSERTAAQRRIAVWLVLLPVWLALGGLLGYGLAPTAGRANALIRLAERVRLEEAGQVTGTIETSAAFRATGTPVEDLYARAIQVRSRVAVATCLGGAFLGLVIGLKLVTLCMRRQRTEFEAEPATCMACARCYRYCPRDHARIKAAAEGIV